MEIPRVQHRQPGEPELHAQYRKNPDAFVDALVRQMKVTIPLVMKRELQKEDHEKMRTIAQQTCFNSAWIFSFGILSLLQCCESKFLAREERE